MLHHRARTILSLLLVMLPVAALVAGLTLTAGTPPSRDRALAAIPAGAQATITATAVRGEGRPLMQAPEGLSRWMDDIDQQPASREQIETAIPANDRLLRSWHSATLVAASGGDLKPGEQREADSSGDGTGAVSGAAGGTTGKTADTGALTAATLRSAVTATMSEAEPEALRLLLPAASRGRAPINASEALVSASLAERLGLRLGDTLTLTAPPFQGGYGLDGRIGDVMQNSQRAWKVVGLSEASSEADVWSVNDWLSTMVEQDGGKGVDVHWLVVGDKPVTWAQVKQLNQLQAVVLSRHVLTDGYPSAGEQYPQGFDPQQVMTALVSLVVTASLGAMLALFLVTPAFQVAADQSRRTLGLAAACGAGPRDMRRIIGLQGLIIGLTGGLLGVALGLATIAAAAPTLLHITLAEVPAVVPWAMLPLAVLAAVLIGMAATWEPARRVERMNVVDALRDRADQDERDRRSSRLRRIVSALAGPTLLTLAALCGWLSLSLPVPSTGDTALMPGEIPSQARLSQALMIVAILLAIAGAVMAERALAALFGRLGRTLPLATRLGCRDAAEHRRRFVPAATAIMATMAVASYALALTGSMRANESANVMELAHGPSHAFVATKVPVNNATDRAMVGSTLRDVDASLPIAAHAPVYALAQTPVGATDGLSADEANALYAQYPSAAPVTLDCSPSQGQDAASVRDPEATPHCVDRSRAFRAGLMAASDLRADISALVMSPEAMHLSGFPGADQAADMLAAGGVVVGNAAAVRGDGTVRLRLNHYEMDDNGMQSTVTIDEVTCRGTWIKGFYPLAMSPQTAHRLGLTRLRYMGDMIALQAGGGWSSLDRLKAMLNANHPLMNAIGQNQRHDWGQGTPAAMPLELMPAVLLGSLAVAATVISLLLARTQTVRDLTTMHAVGASPGFLRRFGLVQATTLLIAGLPLGMASGLALGAFHVAWNRRIGYDGAWLDTVPCWDLQLPLAFGVVAIGLGAAWLVTRPPKHLTRRTLD